MKIERLSRQHVEAVTRLHAASLDGLLATLGPMAIRAYYDGCVESALSVAYVAIDDTGVVGFVQGAASPAALRSDITRRHPLLVTTATGVGMLLHPSAFGWMLHQRRVGDYHGPDLQVPELTYLAVTPAQRGSGIGRDLVTAFDAAMRHAGHPRYELSVSAKNAGALAFYERLGFRKLGEYESFGGRQLRYEKTLAP